MSKFSIILSAALTILLSACGEASSEKAASTEYVKAALKVDAAAQAFNQADYALAQKLCLEAEADVDSIIKKYPETSIALKVVTDGNTRIGACCFTDLRGKILPQLAQYSNPKTSDIALAWSIALSKKDKSARDSALRTLGRLISESFSDKSSPFDADKSKIFINQCVLAADSPMLKSELVALNRDLSLKGETPPAKNSSIESAGARSKSEPEIGDIKLFLSQAKTEASLVAYDLRALESLKNRALAVANADKSIKDEFAKILESSHENAEKISIEKIRLQALSDISLAFSKMGDNKRAVKIAASIKNPENYSEMFSAIARNAGKNGTYADSIAIASKLPEGSEKEKFLTELASSLGSEGMFEEASKTAKLIKGGAARNAAMAIVAKSALSRNDAKAFAEVVSQINFDDAQAFACFAQSDPKKVSPETLETESFANAASLAVGSDDSFAYKANKRAMELSEKIQNKDEFSRLSPQIAATGAKLGKGKEALKFLTSSLHKSNPSGTYDSICELASTVFSKDKNFAAEAFAVASDICFAMPEPMRTERSVELAWELIKIGMPRADAAKVLKDFLPKFGQ